MTIMQLFLDFTNDILNMEFLNIKLFYILCGMVIIIFTFKVIQIIGNANIGRKIDKGEKKNDNK